MDTPRPSGCADYHVTCIDGMVIETRFPWKSFTEKWQNGFVAFARHEYDSARAAGYEVERVFIDHINNQAETFEPMITYKKIL
jgi:hypothetical protein